MKNSNVEGKNDKIKDLWWQKIPKKGDGVYRKQWNFKQNGKDIMDNYDDSAFNNMDVNNSDYNAPFSKALRVLKRVSISTSAIGMAMGPMFLLWAESSHVSDIYFTSKSYISLIYKYPQYK